MKKILTASLISFLILLTGTFINYRAYQEDHHLKYSIKHHGGEITIEHGFGLRVVHIYTMEMNGYDSHSLRFDVFSLLLFYFGILAIVLIILSAISIFKQKKYL